MHNPTLPTQFLRTVLNELSGTAAPAPEDLIKARRIDKLSDDTPDAIVVQLSKIDSLLKRYWQEDDDLGQNMKQFDVCQICANAPACRADGDSPLPDLERRSAELAIKIELLNSLLASYLTYLHNTGHIAS